MELEIIHNQDNGRFETSVEGQVAFVKYIRNGEQLIIVSTSVPKELEGRGIAAALTKYALEYAIENELSVDAVCSYTQVYINRHPEYKSLLD